VYGRKLRGTSAPNPCSAALIGMRVNKGINLGKVQFLVWIQFNFQTDYTAFAYLWQRKEFCVTILNVKDELE
jgi:hypothetical protein